MEKTIKWTCPECRAVNQWEMHTDPEAHYPSMVCDECGHDIEGCMCDRVFSAASLGRRGGLKTKEKYGKNHFKKMIKKRWKKSK